MGVIRRCENCGRNSEWGKNLWIVGNGYVDGGVVGNEDSMWKMGKLGM